MAGHVESWTDEDGRAIQTAALSVAVLPAAVLERCLLASAASGGGGAPASLDGQLGLTSTPET